MGVESSSRVEGYGSLIVTGEEPVDDEEVEVDVGVEAGAEPVEERDSAESGVGRGVGRCVAQGSAKDAEEDGEDASHEDRVVGQEGAEPLREGEDPLPNRYVGNDVVGEMDPDLGHTAGGTGGADAPTLAAERAKALLGAVIAAKSGEPVRQDPAREVAAEVVLDPPRDLVSVVASGLSEEGL